MGRPLHKDINGKKVTRKAVGAEAGIRVQGYFGGALASDYQLIKQRGAKTFVVVSADVDTVSDADTPASISNRRVGKLVSGQPAANGEIRIQGYVNTNSGQLVSIAKLTKRVATDFSGNKYKWYLENDSSNDYIVLTAI